MKDSTIALIDQILALFNDEDLNRLEIAERLEISPEDVTKALKRLKKEETEIEIELSEKQIEILTMPIERLNLPAKLRNPMLRLEIPTLLEIVIHPSYYYQGYYRLSDLLIEDLKEYLQTLGFVFNMRFPKEQWEKLQESRCVGVN